MQFIHKSENSWLKLLLLPIVFNLLYHVLWYIVCCIVCCIVCVCSCRDEQLHQCSYRVHPVEDGERLAEIHQHEPHRETKELLPHAALELRVCSERRDHPQLHREREREGESYNSLQYNSPNKRIHITIAFCSLSLTITLERMRKAQISWMTLLLQRWVSCLGYKNDFPRPVLSPFLTICFTQTHSHWLHSHQHTMIQCRNTSFCLIKAKWNIWCVVVWKCSVTVRQCYFQRIKPFL